MEHVNNSINLLPAFAAEEWQTWVPRAELSPVFEKRYEGEETHLVISARGRFESYGAWLCEAPGIRGDASYILRAEYVTKGVKSDPVSINMIVTWMDENHKWLRREYVDEYFAREDGVNELNKTVDAPSGSHSVKIELEFRWSATGEVCWTKAILIPTEPVLRKKIKVVTTYISPYTKQRDQLSDNLQKILNTIERAGEHQPDLVLFSETMYDRCSSYPFEQTAQPIPGELTQAVCDEARRIRSYIVFNMHERDGEYIYNTSILIDRKGDIIGKYRKTHLPLAEAQAGITPGNDYPVFDTDFGKVGLLICWDISFPEAARQLRLKGAEIVCLSTAGEGLAQQIARAVDNGMYMVVSGINGNIIFGEDGELMSDPNSKPSRVINPAGKILCEIGQYDDGISCIEIDMNKRFYEYWLSVGPTYGEARSLFNRESRPDTY